MIKSINRLMLMQAIASLSSGANVFPDFASSNPAQRPGHVEAKRGKFKRRNKGRK